MMKNNEKNQQLHTATSQEAAKHYSGVTIDSPDDERSDNKQAKDWTEMINNNANSTPLYNPPKETDTPTE